MILINVFLFSVVCGAAYSFSVNFPVCQTIKPDFDSCLAGAIEKALKLFKSGAPEYGLPSLEPLKIDSLNIPSGKSAVHLDQNYKNVETNFDLSNTKVLNAHYDSKQKILKFTTFHPVITQNGEFNANGQLLVIPISGKGPSTTKLYRINYSHEISFEEVVKNGEKYFKIKKYNMKGDPEKVTYKFEGLFGGDKGLNDNINNVLNENWQDIWLDIRRQVRQAYAKVLKDVAQKFFDKVPVKNIFPN